MNLSVCSIGLRDKPVDEAFRIASETGYRYVDLFVSKPDSHAFRTLDKPARERIRRLAQAHGLEICALAGSIGSGFTADRETDRQAALDQAFLEIDLGADLGAPAVRIAPGEGEALEPVMARALPWLRRAAAYAEQKGLRLVMENHSGSITRNPGHAAALCRAVGSPALGVTYDPGNLFGTLVDYKAGLDTMREIVFHVHLKDGIPHYFGHDGFAPQRLNCTLFGEGELDIPWIMERLEAIGYGGCVSVEFEGWHPEYPLPPAGEGLRQMRGYMERWFPA